jgi:hypothetical protein
MTKTRMIQCIAVVVFLNGMVETFVEARQVRVFSTVVMLILIAVVVTRFFTHARP